ncbi:WS/DGAT/MGAT family O-acyltransferase [Nocardioides pocheonensis]|uniref:Diacylglycerol O-acyltransferase n=1 Tax=Nocardioides pocheonensis TaxID=661485 RepID=A0A3N0GPQ5_9ACTN|nr:wax ester/triacylglycerol synthase family O-acyltransferase [Nocardioides pocheonensis]RNM14138.1 wax ester/triacylglycerol synthase family O-acyltransferase [Nocardioides pocheonensis]
MPAIIDPTSLGFLLAETRSQPMHVAGLQLFEKPDDAGDDFARRLFESALAVEEIAPLFKKRPTLSVGSLGQWVWAEDKQFDIEHHVRHNALPQPGRVRELLELVSRLHGTRLARERPLWEAHIIEGLSDGRVAMYTKMHHALVDGISAMRLMQSVLTTDPDKRDMPLPFDARALKRTAKAREEAEHSLAEVPMSALRTAMGLTAEAAGLPAAFIKTLTKGIRNETSALSLHAPKTMFNVNITGSRRFAAQDWPLDRIRAISKASGTTLNDVVLAMCSGAVRSYLQELGRLPSSSLVSMVPVGLKSRGADSMSGGGGNAVGSVMVRLGTDLADPADRLSSIHGSMKAGKEALGSMTPNQIIAMSALGMAPSIVIPMLRLNGIVRPPFNLIISNVPGPRSTQYLNGARLTGTYPVSVPMQGMALNITCNSYADDMCFGLTGCRRSVPHLQRLLTFLDEELDLLESATGVA